MLGQDRHGLLEQHVLPVLESEAGERVVLRVRDGDDHAVELGGCEHLRRVGVDLLDAERPGRRSQTRFDRVGQGCEDGVGVVRERREVGLGRPPAAADDADPRRH